MSSYELVKRTRIDGDFEGFDDEVLFKLQDGTYWIQDKYMYWYHYAYCPTVNILRAGGRLFLNVEGQSQVVPIRQALNVTESKIDGEFNGWEGETAYRLTNGQVWKQCSYSYEYTYSYMPEVLIYNTGTGYKMQVEGTNADVVLIKQ